MVDPLWYELTAESTVMMMVMLEGRCRSRQEGVKRWWGKGRYMKRVEAGRYGR